MKFFLFAFASFFSVVAFSGENWMRYPKISPDGQSIVFSYQGELFVVDAKGGDAHQITSHPAHDFMPIWSNDSKNIVFSSDRFGNYDLFVVAKEGGSPKRLTFHSAADFAQAFKPGSNEVIFSSARLDDAKAIQFPTGALPELYSVSIEGGREKMYQSFATDNLNFSADGNYMLFQNQKSYEDEWRKHHVSSMARDIVLMDIKNNTFKQITSWEGEDRNPIFIDNTNFYFLSEKSGSFNIWKGSINGNVYGEQMTKFTTHPIRFLSASTNGTLCFGFHGDIYTLQNGKESKLNIRVLKDNSTNKEEILNVSGGASEFVVSPDGKEMAFIYRGDVFASSVEFSTTKQITATAGQERNVSFSPDGKKIIYSGERDSSWNIYESQRKNEKETHFYNATLLEEKTLIQNNGESFDPKYSPDGKEIAFLKNRTALQVYNIASKEIRTILDGNLNYSYSDGDQYFNWAPDSKYLLVNFIENERWNTDIGLVAASGKEKPLNLTQSGYGTYGQKFAMNGEMIYYGTDKYGLRSHGGWGSQSDVEAIFLTKDAYYKFTLNEEDYKLWKEAEDEAKKAKTDEADSKKKGKDKDKKEEAKKEEVIPLKIDLDGLYDRKVRLTVHSSYLADFIVNKEGTDLYYLSNFDKGFDLWTTNFKKGETKMISKLGSNGSGMEIDKEEKTLYYDQNGAIMQFDIATTTPKPIAFNSEMVLKSEEERAYMFEHVWRQVREKFYVEDLHGVDWKLYKAEYEKMLPSITTGFDFSELLSEMLGELNASHTGSSYYNRQKNADNTARLACYFDDTYAGDGLKIAAIMDKSPLTSHSDKIKAGTIIEKIDGEPIKANESYYPLLNRKIGHKVLLSCMNPITKEKWDQIVIPISRGEENELAYERWVKRNEHIVDSLSNGKVAYIHVAGMDPESFTHVYDKALGKYNTRDAIIIDTRFNGGGWLHDQLATFLSGKEYIKFEPRGQKNLGGEPLGKWQKPSCVLMNEGNYSDAHLFPLVYQALGIGKLIGMPVAGTGTAVWWEIMIDGHTVFGIPQIGMRSVKEGYLVENHELQPDIRIENEYAKFLVGIDQQLEGAVREMLK
ncbi:MAG: S41 family peptidase [Crocinitomicaceae bacterium]